jgi:hypothetical protein
MILILKNDDEYPLTIYDLYKLEPAVKMRDLRKMKGKYGVYF